MLAYIAGFFDGEGCIGTYIDQYGTVYTAVHVTQKYNLEPLRLIQKHFGGSISKSKSDGTSSVSLCKMEAIPFLKSIEKYLIVKRKQAQLCIELHEHIDKQQYNRWNKPTEESKEYRKFIVNQIKELKHQTI